MDLFYLFQALKKLISRSRPITFLSPVPHLENRFGMIELNLTKIIGNPRLPPRFEGSALDLLFWESIINQPHLFPRLVKCDIKAMGLELVV